uniref:acyl-CoA dehydrogenase family protein n=1 Tax=Thaumasiovibrio occultus TaxID=1891184 RepID=UPI000B363619|nr:acyl-CoA dehydrogenase family protein [Thaumasiovibrio occultus]
MDFGLNAEQAAIQEAARQFAQSVLMPNAAQWDENETFPREVLSQAGQMGFLGLYTPQDHGGIGLSRLDSVMTFEALAMGCTSTTAYMTIHNMVTWMIASFGGEALRSIATELVSGKALGAYCLTEPEAGSDAASLVTSATVVDGDVLLSGSKAFTSGAGEADWLVVIARDEDDRISAYVVEGKAQGLSYGRKEAKMGWHSQPTRSVTFEQVRVPMSHRLGQGGDGFRFAMQGLDGGRLNIAACSIGTAQQALNLARDHCQQRAQFGQPLAQFQGLQFKLADMATELAAARQLLHLAAWKLDEKEPDASAHCAMAKRFATDVGFQVCDAALQLFGGYGYIREYPLERYFRDTRVHQILEGTNEIMRVIVARHVLSEHYNAMRLTEG